MENIPLPKKINFEKTKEKNLEKLVIEPCYPGYGITLGNALRRVLLSSLPGAAVIAVKIKGVDHEFSSLKNVKEDAVEIILNLKQLRLKVFTDEPVILKLKVKGDKAVKAGDIEKNSDVEIVNTDMTIATITDKNTEIDMEITVQKGRGYLPTEAREKEKPEIGTIPIDATFSPIVNIGMKIENVRVAQATNYERLKLRIETDGTITPEDAANQAARILIDHFNLLFEGPEEAPEDVKEEVKEDLPVKEEEPAEEVKEVKEEKEEKADKE